MFKISYIFQTKISNVEITHRSTRVFDISKSAAAVHALGRGKPSFGNAVDPELIVDAFREVGCVEEAPGNSCHAALTPQASWFLLLCGLIKNYENLLWFSYHNKRVLVWKYKKLPNIHIDTMFFLLFRLYLFLSFKKL